MSLHQISVFMENKSGRLAEVTEILGRGGINLRAISIADTADFGICRLIVNNTEKTLQLLKDNGFPAKQTEVLGVEMADEPGALAKILGSFNKKGINIEYLYATLERKEDRAVVIFKVEDKSAASALIRESGFREVTAF